MKVRKSFYIGYKGRREAYIYIWFSKEYKVVYVGETNNVNGVVGRANQHVSMGKGTLYNCLNEKGYDLYELNDLLLLSYSLPSEKIFLSEETAYRISVEYLVQYYLQLLRKETDEPYQLISHVLPGPFVEHERMKNIAKNISDDFIELYKEIN